MTQNLEAPPDTGSPLERHRADHKAEKRWRQHEVQARISKLERKVDSIMPKIEHIFDELAKQFPAMIVEGHEAPKELKGDDRTEG